MADILSFPHKQPNFGNSSATNSGGADVSQAAQPIEDLECGPWTTRKLKIPTSTSGYLVIECFESAEGKRLKGSSKMEPEFRLSNLKIFVQNAFSLDELKVFPYYDNAYNDTDFMSYDFDYPKKGDFIVMVSLTLGGRTAEYKLWL